MDIPSNRLTAEEITEYWKMAQATIADWETIKTSEDSEEYSVYRERLSDAKHGIETILDRLEIQYGDMKNKIGAVKLLKKDLERHADMAKDRYWSIRRS